MGISAFRPGPGQTSGARTETRLRLSTWRRALQKFPRFISGRSLPGQAGSLRREASLVFILKCGPKAHAGLRVTIDWGGWRLLGEMVKSKATIPMPVVAPSKVLFSCGKQHFGSVALGTPIVVLL
jgi:hypothetical protein